MLRTLSAILFAWVLATASAVAAPVQAALDAYQGGDYAGAASIAEAEPSAASLAFAARARIAEAITAPGGFSIEALERARIDAERAIERDPSLVEGHLQAAVALGFRARVIGILKARAEELPERAHAHLERALAIEPSNPWALASLGAWHLEIVTRAGPILASLTYGASESEGLGLFQRAASAAPANAILQMHYALALLALDPGKQRTTALDALARVLSVTGGDALTSFTQEQARTLRSALEAGHDAEAARLVRRYQGYPDD